MQVFHKFSLRRPSYVDKNKKTTEFDDEHSVHEFFERLFVKYKNFGKNY